MSIQEETGPAPASSNGSNGATAAAFVEHVLPRTVPTIERPRKRTTDYRLRGLDLDAPAFTDAPVRSSKRSNPIRRRRRRRLIVQWLVVLVVLALTAVVVRLAVVQPYSINTTAMVPTLEPDTDVLVVKQPFLTGGIDAGDIVVFELPDGASCGVGGASHLVSRVIGLPGQTIWSEGDSIYLDGERLAKNWHNSPFGALGTTPIDRITIPQDSYFVMGDNRTDRCDSRVFGPVSESDVVGEVVATIARNGHPDVSFT